VMLALGMRLIDEHGRALRAASPAPVREKVLPDGSHVQLAAKSSVDIRYTEKQRVLELKNGQAYFALEPNVARPFIVKVGAIYVRAVGTAFDIRRAGDRVVVTVAKGVVDIYPADPNANIVDGIQSTSKSGTTVILRAAAGKQVTWNGSSLDPSTTSIDPDLVLGWRAGRLQYIHEPLDAVIADINRYSAHPVIIRDRAAGEIAFTGTVFVNALDVWLAALPGEFPIDVLTDAKGNTVLASRTTDHP
jgi:transmembrane sensor